MSIRNLRLLYAISGAFVGLFLYLTIFEGNGESSGYLQVAIAFVGLPVLVSELLQIRQAIIRKAELEVGLANVGDLPLSRIRETIYLSNNIEVGQGYPHFFLVIRNKGKLAARFVKIHIEFTSFQEDQKSLYFPVLEIGDFSSQKLNFYKENNADFLFIGGSDWIIYPDDFEVFSFYFTTVVVVEKEPHEIRERPDLGLNRLTCRVWAEGLNAPISVDLEIEIVDPI